MYPPPPHTIHPPHQIATILEESVIIFQKQYVTFTKDTYRVLRVASLAFSLITRCSTKTVLILWSPRAAVPSVVLLLIAVEKKMCSISRFYDRGDRQPPWLLLFIVLCLGGNYSYMEGPIDTSIWLEIKALHQGRSSENHTPTKWVLWYYANLVMPQNYAKEV